MRVSILVPYRAGQEDRDAAWRWVEARLRAMHPDAEVVVGEDRSDGPFSRAAALNDAAERAVGNVLVTHDADSLCGPGQVTEAAELAQERGMVVAFERFRYLTRASSAALLTRPPDHWQPCPPDYDWARDGSVGGVVAVSRGAWDEVGGFDERMRGWGFEDNAFTYSVETLVGPISRVPGDLWHLWHPTAETAAPGSPTHAANERLCARYGEAWGRPDAMRALVAERPAGRM